MPTFYGNAGIAVVVALDKGVPCISGLSDLLKVIHISGGIPPIIA